MATNIISNDAPTADNEKVTEIPAANVRSSLAELEQQSSQIIQRLENIKMQTEQQEDLMSSHFHSVNKKQPSEILSALESLITHSDHDYDSEFCLPPVDEIGYLSFISHSIIPYLTYLECNQLGKVTSKITNDTNRWLSNIFHITDGVINYFNDSSECTQRALKLALIQKFPRYLDGTDMSDLKNVCIYTSNASLMGIQFACRQLGVPLTSIRLIPFNTVLGTLEITELKKIIATDISNNQIPLLLIGEIGTSVCGQVDNLSHLQEICRANDIWLHCRGHSMAALILIQSNLEMKSIADSITLHISSWLGIPGAPITLIHKRLPNVNLSSIDFNPVIVRRLSSLTLWTTLQAYGIENILEKISSAFNSCRILYDVISKIEGLRILSKNTFIDSGLKFPDLLNKPINLMLLFESAVPIVVFKFDGNYSKSGDGTTVTNESADNLDIINKSIDKVSLSHYFDRLNSWLGQILQRDCNFINLDIVDHKIHGTCIRYCPFELNIGDAIPNLENLENFEISLELQIDILRATIKHKETFNKLVEESPVLRAVELSEWAGLGGVHYVPEGWETILTDQSKTELNKLNSCLVETLRATDNAFSLGEGSDGLICIRFGMVTHDTDVEELLDLVIQAGKSIQENSKVLETMTEIVIKGIEAATLDIQRENEEKLWQDGILRQVPLVGRVFNWWSPPEKESGIKGRSLNLTQGVVESTENIYKYHMQIGTHGGQLPGNKSPPTPLVQTPVNFDTSNHSRNNSQSSSTSNQLNQLNTSN